MDSLYFASDTLHIELHVVGTKVVGKGEKFLDIGPYQMRVEIEAFSNAVEKTEASFFVKITPSLWLYMVSSTKPTGSYIHVVDGVAAGLMEHNAHTYGGRAVQDTVAALHKQGAIKETFQYKEPVWEKQNLFRRVDVDRDLEQRTSEQSIQ